MEVISDRVSRFCNKFLKELRDCTCVKRGLLSAYQPQ
jgi:hypothetical protein